MMDEQTVPETFWLVNCGEIQFTLRDDPGPDFQSAKRNDEPTITVDDVFGGEMTLVVAHIAAWWKETPEARIASYKFRKFLRDEEKAATGFDGDED